MISMSSKIKKIPEYINFALKHKLINLIEIITVIGMGIVTYEYGLKVFKENILQAAILVVVIEGTSVAFMLNSYGLTPKMRLTYIGCLLLVSGLINIIHAAKIGDENLDSYFSILIAVLSVLNIFAFNLISILKKNPDLNIKENNNLSVEFLALKEKLSALNLNLNHLISDLNREKELNSTLKEDFNSLNKKLNLELQNIKDNLNKELSEKISEFNISKSPEKIEEKKPEKLNLDLKEDLSAEPQNKKRGRPKKI